MTKNEIRRLFLEKRRSLSKEDLTRLQSALFKNIQDEFDLSEKVVHVFLPIEDKNEIDTFELIKAIQERDKHVIWVIPKCNFEDRELKHYCYDEDTVLAKSKYGIPEPIDGKTAESKDIDIVLVPLLAIDIFGNRIGYGKGFYDRFLAKCTPTCQFIGLSLFEPLQTKIETNDFDIPLHFIASPQQVMKRSHE
ncbi:MAG: 5-formyltetrahydrofolate cyclo-ligase [Flavobacteriales bacterium]|nr:5-formyltetrahydrofolate cyclo-ligase [Flavobacteriales bacterium]